MARRSARIGRKQGTSEGPSASDLTGDNQEAPISLQEEDEALVLAEGRKRKNADNGTDTKPRVKKRRGMRGILSEIFNMPYDILVEIFTQLTPEDLLSLMRTSKDLRAFFRNRENQLVWKAARAHLPGFPECPDDLSEPQYATLAFGQFCFVCLRRAGQVYTVWDARMKICGKCLPKTFSLSSAISVSSELAKYIPKISVVEPGRGGRRYRKVYYHLETLELQYKEAKKSGQDAMKKLLEAREGIYQHSKKCTAWVQECENRLAQERLALIESRKSTVLEHVRAMGWGEEVDKLQEIRRQELHEHPELLKVCKTELTEEGLANILKFLNEHFTKLKNQRIEYERYAHLRKRVPILQNILDTYALSLPNSVGVEVPDLADLFCHPYVRDLIDNASLDVFTTDTGLDSLRAMLPKLIQEVQSTIHDKVVALVAEGYAGSDDFDPKKSLELATTIFSCIGCGYGGDRSPYYRTETIRYSDVMFHRCVNTAASDLSSHPKESDIDFKFLDGEHYCLSMYRGSSADWNRYSQISFNPMHKKILSDVVALAGLDPKTTTTAEMDALDPIFECIPCNLPTEGRATMRWSVVQAHYMAKHKRDRGDGIVPDMKLQVLGKEEAQIARDRLDEVIARALGSERTHMIRCGHCFGPFGGSYPSLEKHLKEEHGILHPTKADMPLRRDTGIEQSVFYMWPPRED